MSETAKNLQTWATDDIIDDLGLNAFNEVLLTIERGEGWFANDAGVADSVEITIPIDFDTGDETDGRVFIFKAVADNTGGAITLSVNSAAPKDIKLGEVDPYAGAIKTDGRYICVYSDGKYRLLNPTPVAKYEPVPVNKTATQILSVCPAGAGIIGRVEVLDDEDGYAVIYFNGTSVSLSPSSSASYVTGSPGTGEMQVYYDSGFIKILMGASVDINLVVLEPQGYGL